MEQDFRLFHIAKLYYVDGLKQNEIADMLGITPMSISRMLKQAEKEGIVEIRVHAPGNIDWEMGHELKRKYKALKDALVVKVQNPEVASHEIGQAAARYVENLAQERSIIGCSWGKTIYEFAHALTKSNKPDMTVVQLSGGFLYDTNYLMMPSNLVKLASEQLGCQAAFLNAPMYVTSEAVCEELKRDALIRFNTELAQKSDIVVLGMSPLTRTNTMTKVGVLSETDMQELADKGAIGDVMGIFIDAKGNLVEWSKNRCYTGVTLEQVSRARSIIALVCETEKKPVLQVALTRGYINTVVISAALAEQLL